MPKVLGLKGQARIGVKLMCRHLGMGQIDAVGSRIDIGEKQDVDWAMEFDAGQNRYGKVLKWEWDGRTHVEEAELTGALREWLAGLGAAQGW